MKIQLPPVMPGSDQAKLCPVRDVLARIGDRWSLLVLITLSEDTLRFSVLKRGIGDISQRMLAQTLRALERDGFIVRKAYPSVPPKVEYSLSQIGQSLLQEITPLVMWADKHHDLVLKAREAYIPQAAIPAL